MIAVTQIKGHQAIVSVGDIIEIDKVSEKIGEILTFETLLTFNSEGGDITIGNPTISGTSVSAKILKHDKQKKIQIFKMKPRKRYRKLQGHRQDYTLIEITSIGNPASVKTRKPKITTKESKSTKKTITKK